MIILELNNKNLYVVFYNSYFDIINIIHSNISIWNVKYFWTITFLKIGFPKTYFLKHIPKYDVA